MSGNLHWQDTIKELFEAFKNDCLDRSNLIHLMFSMLLDKVAKAISERDYVSDGDSSEKDGTDYNAMLACFIFTPADMTEILTKFYSKSGF